MPRQTTRSRPPAASPTRYEDDYYTWIQEQVALLRAGRLDEVDAQNVAEELGDVAKGLVREIKEALIDIVRTLLVRELRPELWSRDHVHMIEMSRRIVRRVLDENPGISSVMSRSLEFGYTIGRLRALGELDLPDQAIPEQCPFKLAELMSMSVLNPLHSETRATS